MKISKISDFASLTTPEGQTGKAESDARRLAIWIERISRFAPEIGITRTEARRCSATKTKIELDAALAVLLEQGRVTLVMDRRAQHIIPTAAILADGWGRK
ncbi:MAG: hypothetical protein IPG52_10510 [Rhodocyclaceae bacterium]|nr:hypothetical protein [Rhodocyclaceae bacterium]